MKNLSTPYIYTLDKDKYNNTTVKDLQWQDKYYKSIQTMKLAFHNIGISNKAELEKVQSQIEPIIMEIIRDDEALSLIGKIKVLDQYTYSHSLNVCLLSIMVGKWIGLSESDLKELAIAGILHDIGKFMIPLNILNKPDRLTSKEFEIVKKHTIHGYEYLKQAPGMSRNISMAIFQHHERMDGTGYPLKLRGDQIHQFAKIIAIVDIFDAMISKRVYKKKESPFKVMEVISEDIFNQLDPQIARTFLQNISLLYVGSRVKLNSNEVGKVVMINKDFPAKPLVQVNDKVIDLSKKKDYKIIDTE